MTEWKMLQTPSRYEHSAQFLERRGALFPQEGNTEESDMDLGHISPLSSDSSLENEPLTLHKMSKINNSTSVRDFDVMEVECTPKQKPPSDAMEMSPLYLSPFTRIPKDTTPYLDTPLKCSPTKLHKTPHENPTSNTELPKLIRKSLLDSSISDKLRKRKYNSQISPSQSKLIKLDQTVHSKVRLALFSSESDISLPPKSFYPKTELPKRERQVSMPLPPVKKAKPAGGKKSSARGKLGQINAGVKHKIRKPKERKLSKKVLKKALDVMNDPALQEYMKDLEMLKQPNQITQIIENKENICPSSSSSSFQTESLKQVQTESENNKFFKSTNESKADLDTFESFNEDEPLITGNIESILDSLDDKVVDVLDPKDTQTVANILDPKDTQTVANILLSPTSQMCDMASGLAINSPKKARNLSAILENMGTSTTNENAVEQKLFPIFSARGRIAASKVAALRGPKKLKNLPKDQMLLDAGQKRFGATECSECGFIYHMGDPNDEIMHTNYHNNVNVLKFGGWKNERIVTEIDNHRRIIKIVPSDSKIWWKRVKDLAEVVNQNLGYFDMNIDSDDSQVYLYIKNRMIVGFLHALPRTEAYKMLTLNEGIDLCSEEVYPVKCGITRIWVLDTCRKQGIATALLDSLKKNFMFGYCLTNNDIALSSPTEMGKNFAQKYFQTGNYMIYM